MIPMFSLPKRLLPAACLLCFLLAGLTAGAARAEETLNVGILQYYPPFAFQDKGGRMSGFDVEFAEALCRQMARPCRLQALPLTAIVDGMADQSLDMAVAGLVVTGERRRAMLFSEPYYHARSLYVGRRGLTLSREALRGGKLAALYNSIQFQVLQKRWKEDAAILGFEALPTLLDALVRGRVHVVLLDEISAGNFLESPEGADFAVLDKSPLPQDAADPSCVAVSRRFSGLEVEVNAAIDALRASGEYDRIMRKYFLRPID